MERIKGKKGRVVPKVDELGKERWLKEHLCAVGTSGIPEVKQRLVFKDRGQGCPLPLGPDLSPATYSAKAFMSLSKLLSSLA